MGHRVLYQLLMSDPNVDFVSLRPLGPEIHFQAQR
jgi:hypothetical protein